MSSPSDLQQAAHYSDPALLAPQRSFLWALRQAALGLLLLTVFVAAGAWLLDASIDRTDAAQAATSDGSD